MGHTLRWIALCASCVCGAGAAVVVACASHVTPPHDFAKESGVARLPDHGPQRRRGRAGSDGVAPQTAGTNSVEPDLRLARRLLLLAGEALARGDQRAAQRHVNLANYLDPADPARNNSSAAANGTARHRPSDRSLTAGLPAGTTGDGATNADDGRFSSSLVDGLRDRAARYAGQQPAAARGMPGPSRPNSPPRRIR